MLLTAPARRKSIADFRLGGARRSVMVELVLFQALCLGIAASLVGALAGYVLLRAALHERPGYLAQAFTLGGGTVIGVWPLVFALAGGVVATLPRVDRAAARPSRGRALDAVYLEDGEPGHGLGHENDAPICDSWRRSRCSAARSSSPTVPWLCSQPASWRSPRSSSYRRPLWHLASGQCGRRAVRRSYQPLRSAQVVARDDTALARADGDRRGGAVRRVALGGARSDLLEGLHRGALANTVDGSVLVLNPGDTEQTTPFTASPTTSPAWATCPVWPCLGVSKHLHAAREPADIRARPADGHRSRNLEDADHRGQRRSGHKAPRGTRLGGDLAAAGGRTPRTTRRRDEDADPGRGRAVCASRRSLQTWVGRAGRSTSTRLTMASTGDTAAPTALVLQLTPGSSPAGVRRAVALCSGRGQRPRSDNHVGLVAAL